MLGVTRETVNRELMKLRHQGILVKDKKRIIVKDITRLLDII
jgi:CRP-like cAMP-binding protein